MLKRLVVPGMALEDEQDKRAELQIMPDREQGYDPYGSAKTPGKTRR